MMRITYAILRSYSHKLMQLTMLGDEINCVGRCS